MDIISGQEGVLGAEVRGTDLNGASTALARDVLEAVHTHALVRFKTQKMTVREYNELGRKLGEIMPYPDERYRHSEYPDVFVSSNVKGRSMGMARSGYFWHTDLSFKPKPQALTVLYPQLLPQNKRETLFVDMSMIYETMPAALRNILEGRTAKHDPVLRYKVGQADVDANLDLGELIKRGRDQFPAPTHPCVITHPTSGKKILYMNEGFTTQIDGLPYEESQAVLKEVFAFIDKPEHIRSHCWELGDIIIWDNRYLIHRAGYMAPGDFQTIFRLGIDDKVPFYVGIAEA